MSVSPRANASCRGLSGTNVASFPDRGPLEELGKLAAHGGLRVAITGRYTLAEAVKALADARERHSRGKLVIEVADQPLGAARLEALPE